MALRTSYLKILIKEMKNYFLKNSNKQTSRNSYPLSTQGNLKNYWQCKVEKNNNKDAAQRVLEIWTYCFLFNTVSIQIYLPKIKSRRNNQVYLSLQN